ncbi:MAG: phage tail protein [Leptolyngbyaceae cyanobacterium SM1_1_3]|nr:phage tail protein [Leptolyngbyaceae cyanobacterium SM1_1_3]NJN03590.1 phage tail protein [Leptolyngbyaceae cyanobacterium RM1_1_2]NJO09460.1 phage tail protein [Leptolyngbyaceae cyanobacterium SL_1_1]
MPEDKSYELIASSRFYLEIHLDGSDDRIDGYFMDCQGFKRSQEVIDLCEVTPQKWGKNGTPRGRMVRVKMPGNMKSENITLKRGMTISKAMWEWFTAVEEGKWSEQRRDGDLTLYDQAAEESTRFRFSGAWPVSYKISDVKADSKEFELEEVELSVDEFKRVK